MLKRAAKSIARDQRAERRRQRQWEQLQAAEVPVPASNAADDTLQQPAEPRTDIDTPSGTAPRQLHPGIKGAYHRTARKSRWDQSKENVSKAKPSSASQSATASHTIPSKVVKLFDVNRVNTGQYQAVVDAGADPGSLHMVGDLSDGNTQNLEVQNLVELQGHQAACSPSARMKTFEILQPAHHDCHRTLVSPAQEESAAQKIFQEYKSIPCTSALAQQEGGIMIPYPKPAELLTYTSHQRQAFMRGDRLAVVTQADKVAQSEEQMRLDGDEVSRVLALKSPCERKRQLALLVRGAKRKRGPVPLRSSNKGILADRVRDCRQWKLPDEPSEWAWDIDEALGARGEWYQEHMQTARKYAGTEGLVLIDLCCGILTSLYGAYLAGLKIYRCYGVDIDNKGDHTHVIGTRLASTLSDHAPELISSQVVRDLRELGDDVIDLARNLHKVTNVISEAPLDSAVMCAFEWPCVQNSLRDWKHNPQPGVGEDRWTDVVLEACESIVNHAKRVAQSQGRCFVSVGENTPMWISGDSRFTELPKEVQIGRQKTKRDLILRLCQNGACVLRDAAWLSASTRLRDIYCSNFIVPPCPHVLRRDAVDVLDDDHRPQTVPNHHIGGFPWAPGNIPGQMRAKMPTRMRRYNTESMLIKTRKDGGPGAGLVLDDRDKLVRPRILEVERLVGFYASWAPHGLTGDQSLDSVKGTIIRERVLGNVIDAQFMTWIMASVLHTVATFAGLASYRETSQLEATDEKGPTASTTSTAGAGKGLQAGFKRSIQAAAVPDSSPGVPLMDMERFSSCHSEYDEDDYKLHTNTASKWLSGEYVPDIDVSCDVLGKNIYKSKSSLGYEKCLHFLSPAKPLQHNFQEVVGKVFWGNLPFSQIESSLAALWAAIRLAPSTTWGTVLVPKRFAPWLTRWVHRKRAPCRVAGEIPPNRQLFTFPDRRNPDKRIRAGPTSEPMLVLRMGFPPSYVDKKVVMIAEKAKKAEIAPEAAVAAPGDMSAVQVADEARSIEHELRVMSNMAESDELEGDFVTCKKDNTMSDKEEGDKNGVTQRDREEWAEAKLAAWPILRDFNKQAEYGWDVSKGSQWQHSTLKMNRDPAAWYVKHPTVMTPSGTSRMNPIRWAQWINQIPEAKIIGAEALVIIYHGAGTVSAYPVPFSDIPNHSSCVAFADRIEAELEWYDKSGIHEWLPEGVPIEDFIDRVNPFLIVVRSPDDGKGRLCINCTKGGFNDSIITRPYRQTSAAERLRRVKPTFFQIRKDLCKAFFHLQMSEKSRRTTGFRCPKTGRIGRYTGPPFGKSDSPEHLYVVMQTAVIIFQHITSKLAEYVQWTGSDNLKHTGHTPEEVKALSAVLSGIDLDAFTFELSEAGDALEVYVDDFCGCGAILALALLDGIMTLEGDLLGIVWEPEKDLAGRRIVSLGAVIIAPELKMCVQPRKAVSYASFIQQQFMDNKDHITKHGAERNALQKLRGRLGYVAQMSRWANLFLEEVDRAMYPGDGSEPLFCVTSDRFWETLTRFWLPFLQEGSGRWLECSQWEVLPHHLAVTQEHFVSTSDASGHLGGGVVSALGDFTLLWNKLEMEWHITFKELCAAIYGIFIAAEQYTGARVMLELDNKAAVSYVNRGRGRDRIGLELLFQLAWICIYNKIQCRAIHRSGNAMKAWGSDGLSRGKGGTSGRSVSHIATRAPTRKMDDIISKELKLKENQLHAHRVDGLNVVGDLSHLRKKELLEEGADAQPIKHVLINQEVAPLLPFVSLYNSTIWPSAGPSTANLVNRVSSLQITSQSTVKRRGRLCVDYTMDRLQSNSDRLFHRRTSSAVTGRKSSFLCFQQLPAGNTTSRNLSHLRRKELLEEGADAQPIKHVAGSYSSSEWYSGLRAAYSSRVYVAQQARTQDSDGSESAASGATDKGTAASETRSDSRDTEQWGQAEDKSTRYAKLAERLRAQNQTDQGAQQCKSRRKKKNPTEEMTPEEAMAASTAEQLAALAFRSAVHDKQCGCSQCGEIIHNKADAVRCISCYELWHRSCAGLPDDSRSRKYKCGKCTVGMHGEVNYGSNVVLSAKDLGLNSAAALIVQSKAAGTATTYDSSVSMVIKVIQKGIYRRSGKHVPDHVIMPLEPMVPMPVEFILSFLGEAVALYKTNTIEGKLSAIAAFHRDKSENRLRSPTWEYRVTNAMAGIRRIQGGTAKGVARAAFALPLEVVDLIVDTASEMAAEALEKGDLRQAHGHARDALWYTITFLATLRKKETVQLRRTDIKDGVAEGTVHVFVKQSKVDQNSVGASVVVAKKTASEALCLQRQLKLFNKVLSAMRISTDVLFGSMDDPHIALKAAGTFLQRMQDIYLVRLEAQGFPIPDGLRLTGHSFRRGGICAIRDAARARGMADGELRSLLMRHGRWKDARSLEVYLVDNWVALASLTLGL